MSMRNTTLAPGQLLLSVHMEKSYLGKAGYPPGGGGELNLDQTDMCHQHLKFITLFLSGKTKKEYLALELLLLL